MNPDLFTTPEGIAKVRASQDARFESEMIIDWILELQKQWKSSKHQLEQSVARVNVLKKVCEACDSRLFCSFSPGHWSSHEGQGGRRQKGRGL